MKIQEITDRFHIENYLNKNAITLLQNDSDLRKELIKNTVDKPDRVFAIALLNQLIAIRKLPEGIMPVDDLMLACYNLGLCGYVEDCLKIWEVKNIDFDTYCGLDIQLVMFAGIEKTITYLKQQTTIDAANAHEYITKCMAAGDFEDLDKYFSAHNLPYFV